MSFFSSKDKDNTRKNSICVKCKQEIKGTTYVCSSCQLSNDTYCIYCVEIIDNVIYCPDGHKMG